MGIFRLFIIVYLNTLAFSNTIFLDNTQTYQNILTQSEIYIDKTRKLTIEDIEKQNIEFQKNDKKLLAFGYSPNFDVWVKFTLKNTTNEKLEKIIEYDNPLTTNVTFYFNKDRYIKEGSLNISDDRKALTPNFKIVLEANEEKIYYLKVSSYITTLIVKLNLWDVDSFYEKEIKHQLILALFFGAMTILALYNLSIFFFVKEFSYFYYVLYILGIILHQLVYVGMGNLYLFNSDILNAIIKYAAFLVTFPALALGFFTKSFLNIKQYFYINKFLNIFLLITLINSFIFIFIDSFNEFRTLIPFLLLIYLMLITIYASIKRNRQAYFILIGWIIFLSSGMFMFLSSAGIVNIYDKLPYYVEVSLVLEAIIFSIALADRIKQLQKERNEINKELIIQQKEEGKRLKIQVEEKTKDLKEALDEKGLLLKELHHRVKNNMQMIVSLIRLQADEIVDEKVNDIFTTIQNRISAMSHLHELLYRQDNIAQINAFEYFDIMIDELRQSYNTENITIGLNIKAELQIEQAIYCGLILNELVTNSIKYGFEDKNGTIKLLLEKTNDTYIFQISDNGKGYDRSKETNSLGLLLVDTLVKKQLKGSVDISAKDGVNVCIKWSIDDQNKSFNS